MNPNIKHDLNTILINSFVTYVLLNTQNFSLKYIFIEFFYDIS